MSRATRREFLARSTATAAVTVTAGLSGLSSLQADAVEPLLKGTPNADKLGWRIGFSAYSFRTVTVFEALDKMAATGLHYTELFAWQKLSPNDPDAKPAPGLSKVLQRDIKKKAADSSVKMIGIYASLDNADSAKATFAFAAEMGLKTIVAEPPTALLDTIEKLTEEYDVYFALHNHPKPSNYWNPETGLAALEKRSPRMGFCCDTGHWCRCGLEPVEALKTIGKRAKTFHLKDLDRFGVREAKDVIWGRGKGRIADILAEVKRLGIKNPYFGIEWERDPNEPLETHAKSVAYLEKIVAKLAAS